MTQVNLCVLRLPLKRVVEQPYPFRQDILDAFGITSSNKKELDSFFEELQDERVTLLRLLKEEEALDEDIDRSLGQYLSNLNHLMVPFGAEGEAPLKTGFSFVWEDTLCSTRRVVVKNIEYEIVNMLLSTALWKCRSGMSQMNYSEKGLTTAAAAKSFLLYRKAIGIVEYCEHLLRENADDARHSESTDADLKVITPLKHFMYAEIQGITVLRAIEKGNAPSLISSLAAEAQHRYEQSIEQEGMQNVPDAFLHKLHAYASYKAACFKSYSLLYFAWTKLSNRAGGAAVRLATEAAKVFEEAVALGITYDRTSPQTNSAEREVFHSALQRSVKTAQRQTESDNRHVYYDRIPTELPELPQPKQLIGSLPFEFPGLNHDVDRSIFDGLKTSEAMKSAPDTVIEVLPGGDHKVVQVDGVEQDKKSKETDSGSSRWWKWLIFIIATPLLLMITVFGFGVWIVLIPFKIFCWPVGMLAQLLWNVVEYLIKAPLRAMKWASGQEWRATPTTEAPSGAGG